MHRSTLIIACVTELIRRGPWFHFPNSIYHVGVATRRRVEVHNSLLVQCGHLMLILFDLLSWSFLRCPLCSICHAVVVSSPVLFSRASTAVLRSLTIPVCGLPCTTALRSDREGQSPTLERATATGQDTLNPHLDDTAFHLGPKHTSHQHGGHRSYQFGRYYRAVHRCWQQAHHRCGGDP